MLTTFKERAVAETRTVFAELDLLSPLQPPASTRPQRPRPIHSDSSLAMISRKPATRRQEASSSSRAPQPSTRPPATTAPILATPPEILSWLVDDLGYSPESDSARSSSTPWDLARAEPVMKLREVERWVFSFQLEEGQTIADGETLGPPTASARAVFMYSFIIFTDTSWAELRRLLSVLSCIGKLPFIRVAPVRLIDSPSLPNSLQSPSTASLLSLPTLQSLFPDDSTYQSQRAALKRLARLDQNLASLRADLSKLLGSSDARSNKKTLDRAVGLQARLDALERAEARWVEGLTRLEKVGGALAGSERIRKKGSVLPMLSSLLNPRSHMPPWSAQSRLHGRRCSG